MVKSQESKESLQESLQQVIRLLNKHKLVEGLVHKQDMPKHDLVESLVHKQNLAELHKKLDALHPADVAYILEALPLEQRLDVWDMVKAERDGEILLEVSDAVRQTLIADMDSDELLAAPELSCCGCACWQRSLGGLFVVAGEFSYRDRLYHCTCVVPVEHDPS